MTQLDERPTLEIEATQPMRPPRRFRLRDYRVAVVVGVGVVLVGAALWWWSTNPGAIRVPSVPPAAASPASVVSQGPRVIVVPTDGATLPATPAVAVGASAAAPPSTQAPVSAPVAVVVASSPPARRPSPSGSASGSPSPSPSPSGSSASAGTSPSVSPSEQES